MKLHSLFEKQRAGAECAGWDHHGSPALRGHLVYQRLDRGGVHRRIVGHRAMF